MPFPTGLLERVVDREGTLEKLGLEGKFVVGYIGTHGMAHYLENILEAARLIQNYELGQNIHFLFLGEGSTKAKIELLARELKLKNIIFLDPPYSSGGLLLENTDYRTNLSRKVVHHNSQ